MTRGGKREGAGRPKGTTKGEGMPTHVVRVSADITKEQCDNILTLKDILNHWEDECLAAGEDSARHYFLRQAVEEIRALGY